MGADVRYAGFWIRFLAACIDGVILLIIMVPVTIVMMVLGVTAAFSSADNWEFAVQGTNLLAQVLSTVICVAYYAGFQSSKFRATPGKLALGIEVVGTQGETTSLLRGVGRYFAQILSSIILCIGYIMAGFHPQKRSLHDIVAGTYVVYKKPQVVHHHHYHEEQAPATQDTSVNLDK